MTTFSSWQPLAVHSACPNADTQQRPSFHERMRDLFLRYCLWLVCLLVVLSGSVQAQTSSQSVFTNQVPVLADVSDGTSYELGMKFTTTTAGQVTAIRYWKASTETGSHTGRLWTAGGQLLGTATFTNETASGWQTAALSVPITLQPNTVHVVSVNANSHFSDTYDVLSVPIVNGNLSSVADGSNGVFGSISTFPTGSFRNSNYFRDIVFVAGVSNPLSNVLSKVSGDNQSGVVSTVLPQPLVVQVTNGGTAVAGVPLTFGVTAGGGSVSSTSVTTNAQGRASVNRTLGSTAGTNTVRVSGTGLTSVTFTATATASTVNVLSKVSGDNQTAPVSTVLPQPLVVQVTNGGTAVAGVRLTFGVTAGGGSVSSTSVTTNAQGRASVNRTLGSTAGTNTVRVSGTGLTSVSFNATAQSGSPAISQSVFTNQVPVLADVSDGTSYELGMKFTTTTAGQVTAIRYWKASTETGSHIGRLWTAGGQLLGTATFTNETASGWQQANLATPIDLQANTVYVVSVNANSHFGITYDVLGVPIVNGNLSSVADGNNGVFGSISIFPTGSFRNSNYFRDIVFVAGVSNPPSNVLSKVSGDNQSGVVSTVLPQPLVVQVTNGGTAVAGVPLTFGVTAGGGSVSSTTVTTNAQGQASVNWTLGSTLGTHTVQVSGTGLTSVGFNATANAPSIVNFTINNTVPAQGIVGVPLSTPYAVKVTDAVGIPIANFPVNFVVTAGGGTLTAANSQGIVQTSTNSLGIAQTIYTVGTRAGYNSVEARIAGQTRLFVTTGIAGPATQIRFSSKNSSVFVGQAATIVSTLLDVYGNVANSSLPVTFSTTGPNGSFSPSATQNAVNGVSQVSFTPTDAVGSPRVIRAASSGLSSDSRSLTVLAAGAQANPIVFENQQPGTTDWQITNQSKGPENNDIEAYASAPSVNLGGVITFYVNTGTQPLNYQMDIYRMGYYEGKGGRLMQAVGVLPGQSQPPCQVTEPVTRLVSCSWSPSHTLNVPANWASGFYVAKLTRQNTGSQTYIWFVVRNDSSPADIVFKSSFNTFQAYNSYGGYSLYGFNSTNNQRAYKVSLDRPFSQALGTASTNNNFFFVHEFPMIRWLESQGYDMTYITDLDTELRPQVLNNHRVFLDAGHDEYWSLEQRLNVTNTRNNGTNLAFFSANTAYWRVRFEPNAAGVPNRVMVCYKQDYTLDPSWTTLGATTLFRDPANNLPENALLGVLYIGDNNDDLGGGNFVVTNSSHPYFANTGLQNGDFLSQLVGFEWDAIRNNGFSPPNLEQLSASPVVAESAPPGENVGSQISNATRYVAASGAKVFAVGSIQWSWGLDDYNPYNVPPRIDSRAQQITVNVLADMNARPQTFSSGVVVP